MKARDIRELSNDDLRVNLNENRTELFNLRFQMATSQLDNTSRITVVKKDIARLLTEIRERELAQEAINGRPPAVKAAKPAKPVKPARAGKAAKAAKAAQPAADETSTTDEPAELAVDAEI